jgi:protocatechuate 3,4-dioxygenase beta subunit
MDHDDRPIGQVLSRREMLKLLAVAGVAAAAGCAPRLGGTETAPTNIPATAPVTGVPASSTTPGASAVQATALPVATTTTVATAEPAITATAFPACVVRPAQTEGPFFVDEMLNRSDIRTNTVDGTIKPGAPLALTFLVSRVGNACEPLPGAIVDIWHCDAAGVYSGVNDIRAGSTAGQDFLRGYQITDAGGLVSFTTVYPGWYPGRAVHIHFKIRTEEGGRNYDFTSQLYFDDAFTDQVYQAEPYAARGGRNTRNADDGLYRNGGDQLLLNVIPVAGGYATTFDIGLQIG